MTIGLSQFCDSPFLYIQPDIPVILEWKNHKKTDLPENPPQQVCFLINLKNSGIREKLIRRAQ